METKHENFMDNKPLFSIIMPCYNSEKYIDRAVQSCINQTYNNWELIIVNDGSTDNTLNIIESYASQDKRIHVYSKENGGYVSAVNYGLNHICGIYFLLLGSDDELTPSLFSDIHERIKPERSPDMIAFKTIIKKADKTFINDNDSDFGETAEEYNSNIKDFSVKYPKQSKIFFIRDTSKIYKTELLGSLRYFGKKGMDADGIFSMLFAHKSSSFLCVPVFGYIWYLRHDSLSGRKQNFITQADRINNWIEFGNEIIHINPDLIPKQEKKYLIYHFYSIIESTVISYFSKCKKENTVKTSKAFLKKITIYFKERNLNKEIYLFLNHTPLWICYIFPYKLYKTIKKRLKKLFSRIVSKIKFVI